MKDFRGIPIDKLRKACYKAATHAYYMTVEDWKCCYDNGLRQNTLFPFDIAAIELTDEESQLLNELKAEWQPKFPEET